jgi:GxxExxY protein
MDHEKHEGHERELLYRDEVFRIQGAIFEVHRTLGPGFLESAYPECLDLELRARGVEFVPLKRLPLTYKGRPLRQSFVADFVCFDRIILELKALREVAPEHRAQTLNYLRATGLKLGLLVNFGSGPKVKIDRFAL